MIHQALKFRRFEIQRVVDVNSHLPLMVRMVEVSTFDFKVDAFTSVPSVYSNFYFAV